MFILILAVTLSLLILLFFNKSHVIAVNNSQVKYPLKESDKRYFDKKGVKQNYLPVSGLFYTNSPWNESNYFKYNNKYYLIEPGYYYNVIPEAEFFANRINCVTIP
jgi:hypothetical protein